MESFVYPQFGPNSSTVHIALYNAVKNAGELRNRIIRASTLEGPEGDAEREAVNFAFVEARLVSVECLLMTLTIELLDDSLGDESAASSDRHLSGFTCRGSRLSPHQDSPL